MCIYLLKCDSILLLLTKIENENNTIQKMIDDIVHSIFYQADRTEVRQKDLCLVSIQWRRLLESPSHFCEYDYNVNIAPTQYSIAVLEHLATQQTWLYLTAKARLSEDFMTKYSDKVDWRNISRHQIMSDEFVTKNAHHIDMRVLILYGETKLQLVEEHGILRFRVADITRSIMAGDFATPFAT